MPSTDPAAQAREILASNSYLTIATADADGRPWATPVWFAVDELDAFCWVSRPGARHSLNIAVRPAVALVVFDSTLRTADAVAVYVEAEAAEVEPGDQESVLAVFNQRSLSKGLPTWSADRIVSPGQFRLYRATVSRMYVLDEHDQRVPVGRIPGNCAPDPSPCG